MLLAIAVSTVLPLPSTSPTGLLIFVKAPRVGHVKTRLGKSIGLEQSCKLYRCFGLDFLARLQILNWPLLIFYAPEDGKALVQDWLGTSSLHRQTGANLGDRMCNAFQTGFELGFERLMIFGSDSPDIPVETIKQGIEALSRDRVVIGPSNDGGYYTIGFSRWSWCPDVFQGIQWSTETVYPDSLNILRSQTASVEILPAWDDIDTLADLQNLYQRNQKQDNLPRTLAYIQANLMPMLSKSGFN